MREFAKKFPDFPRAIFWGEFPIVSVISYKFWLIYYNQIEKTIEYLKNSRQIIVQQPVSIVKVPSGQVGGKF